MENRGQTHNRKGRIMNARWIWAGLVVAAVAAAAGAQTSKPAPATRGAAGPASRLAPSPAAPKPVSEKDAQAQAAAQEAYAKIVADYLKGEWPAFNDEMKVSGKHSRFLTPAQRQDLVYMRTAAPEFRPPWWDNCKKTSNVSFTAKIWGREFAANYMPSELLGMQAPVGILNGKLIVVVSWKPSLVDNPKAVDGYMAKRFNLTRGDLGEAMVWHELGHNYISLNLPLNAVIELYNDHSLLFAHLQEFYADMTALYHAGPKARLTTLLFRIDAIEEDSEDECHARSAMAIASLLLANILPDLSKWPSVHLPPAVPDKDVERQTALYVYDHLDPNWSLGEDKALREIVKKFIFDKGEQVLRGKGDVQLPNRLSYKLMASEDRDWQKKRDAWVAEQLKKAIDAGRADKPESAATTRRFRGSRILPPA